MSSSYSDSLLFCKWKVLSFERLTFHGVIHENFLCPIPTNLCIQNVRHAWFIFQHVYALLDIALRFNGLCYLFFPLLPFPFLVYGFCDPLRFLPMCYKLQLNFEFGPLKTCYDEYVGEVLVAMQVEFSHKPSISMMLSSLKFG